ncbi:MAG TPA: S8 family serine peptidase [Steroidobacteraceae bacterium]|nr:S8 family serine peptidase [Steroidobacteraceae bacterium]
MRFRALTLLLLIAPVAAAQVGLPAVRLPQVPGVTLPNLPAQEVPLDVDKSAAALAGEVDPRRLRELRALRIRELLRRHRDVLEADPHGAPIVRGELLALSPSAAALQAAGDAGFSVVREHSFGEPGTRIVVLHATGSTARALVRLQGLDPAGVYDFNHLYTDSGAPGEADMSAAQPAPDPGGVTRADEADGGAEIRLGLIDSGVDVTHEVFSGVKVQQHGCARAVPADHGTAVASLMVGRASALHGAAPGSALYAVDVFCGLATGGAVDAVAEAFAWLLHEQVPVINVSLVGPPNRTLAGIVQNVLARGYLVVAAVGNDGPAAPPLYPAAWPGVVGVTAVDARQQVLVEALRGPQVKFAAPGADMAAARPHQAYALVRGTSFASPIVAGLLALELHTPEQAAAQQAVAALARRALDLGAPGFDPVYGYGLVGADLRRQPALARLGAH